MDIPLISVRPVAPRFDPKSTPIRPLGGPRTDPGTTPQRPGFDSSKCHVENERLVPIMEPSLQLVGRHSSPCLGDCLLYGMSMMGVVHGLSEVRLWVFEPVRI